MSPTLSGLNNKPARVEHETGSKQSTRLAETWDYMAEGALEANPSVPIGSIGKVGRNFRREKSDTVCALEGPLRPRK
jgi:hypothetical protein